jgi:hypothetical protein
MIPLLAPLLGTLASSGLNLLRGAIEAKGKDVVEKTLGVKIPNNPSNEDLLKLKELEMAHEERLLELAVEKQQLDLEQSKVLAEVQMNENDNVSERWKSDIGSDSWLSKNVRPLALCFLLGTMFLVMVLSACKVDIKENLVSLLENVLELVGVAYFGGRSIEKVVSARVKK